MNHARASKPAIQKIHDVLFAATEKNIRDGNAKPSFLRTHLETFWRNSKEGRENELTLSDIKGAAGAIFIAGGNTTWSTITVSILNMLMNPDVQRKAQDELDSVVGKDRLPTLEDRASLPYMEHIIQETYRWAPLSPLGVPHKTLENDIYKGMLIPKGSVVYANAKAMTHDESTYRNPYLFSPDRYLSKESGGAGGKFTMFEELCYIDNTFSKSLSLRVHSVSVDGLVLGVGLQAPVYLSSCRPYFPHSISSQLSDQMANH